MKRRSGFTMAEMLVAIIVVAILAAVGVNQVLKPVNVASESFGIAQITSVIEATLGEAIRRPNNVVTMQVGTGDVRVLRDGTEVPQYRQAFPGGISATALTLTAQSDGTFQTGGSTTLSSRDFSYALTIDRAGRVSR